MTEEKKNTNNPETEEVKAEETVNTPEEKETPEAAETAEETTAEETAKESKKEKKSDKKLKAEIEDLKKKYGADLVSALPAYPDGGTTPNLLIKAKECAKAEAGICIPL